MTALRTLSAEPQLAFRRFLKGVPWPVYGLLAMAFVDAAAGQSYTFTTPVSGGSEVDLSFGAGSSGGMVTSFGTLNETLYYDPLAQTLRQVGSVSLAPSNGSFPIQWFAWPGPPASAPTGTASLVIGDGTGRLAFDTGIQPISPGSDQYYWTLTLPVSGACTVVNGGQTNSGSVDFSFELGLGTEILSQTSSNLIVSEFVPGGAGGTYGGHGATEVANIGGIALFDGSGDNTYQYSWNIGSVSAVPAPEPGSLALLGLGAAMAAILVKAKGRKKRKADSCRKKMKADF